MKSSLYTNTSNLRGIVGLLIVTVATAYAAEHATDIVNGVTRIAKNGWMICNEKVLHRGKKQYAVAYRTYSGRIIDTGDRIWR